MLDYYMDELNFTGIIYTCVKMITNKSKKYLIFQEFADLFSTRDTIFKGCEIKVIDVERKCDYAC